MGVYDLVGPKYFQIKCTPDPEMHLYGVGEEIPLPDGLYLTREGWFTVRKGKVYNWGEEIRDKWGNWLSSVGLIDSNNPIEIVVEGLQNGTIALP